MANIFADIIEDNWQYAFDTNLITIAARLERGHSVKGESFNPSPA